MLSGMMDPRSDATVPVKLVRQGSGFAAVGPGFYVWDLDAGTVARAACELAEASATREEARSLRAAASARTSPRASLSRLPVRRPR